MERGLGMELTKSEIARAVDQPAVARLAPVNLARFDAAQLAQVLEQEIRRAEAHGLSHVSLNMSLVDCTALAKCLRRASIMGA